MGYGWPSLERERIPIGYPMLMNYWRLMDVSERGRERGGGREGEREREREGGREGERERGGGEGGRERSKCCLICLDMRGFMTQHGRPDNPRSARYILKDYVNVQALYYIIALLQHFLIIIAI